MKLMSSDLTKKQRQIIIDQYQSDKPRALIQKELGEIFCKSVRTIRQYAKDCGVGGAEAAHKGKVMVYDIETSRVRADLWSTGKQFVGHKQLRSETKIISISWKWIGDDKVHALTWDKDHCDKTMLTKFIKQYNKATLVIGQNNNSFDNKHITTRAAKHRLFVNRFVKSFDIYRMAKKTFNLQSYSMAYMAKYFGLTPKLIHEGIHMWEMVEYGTKSQQKEYLKKMVEYNVGDIVTTEELYLTLRPYFGSVTNVAAQQGQPKWACPITASTNVKHHDTLYTEAGTVQRILYCEESDHQYKVTNKSYMDFLERQMYG